MLKRSPLLLMLGAAVSACSVGPDYHASSPAALGVPEQFSVAADSQVRADYARWWTQFDDPLLAQLVERGRAGNLDVAQAAIRLRQARESLVQARSALFPRVNGTGSYSRNQSLAGGTTRVTLPDGTVTSFSSGSSDSFSIGADVSYQVDLFGGNRRSAEASRAQYEGSGFDYAALLISIEAEVARNYVLARLQQAQIANARASLGIQDENLEIAGWRVQAGLVSSLDSEQARSQRAQTAATIPQVESSYNQSVTRIAVLLGEAPARVRAELEAVQPIPRGPVAVPVGIPAEILRQRPDVRGAERTLVAATARIGVAQAALYPSLSIGGSITTSASAFDDLFNVITGRLFGNVAQTIFDAGRLRSQLRSNRAAAEGAFFAYRGTVVDALADIENALVALRTAEQRETLSSTALDAANNTAILSRDRYRTGLTDFTTLNQSESALLTARNSLSQAQSDKATALVQLFLALGGGWDSNVVPSVDTVSTPAPQER